MSKIQERIAEIDKASKKSRLINTILWVVVFGLVGLSGWFYLDAVNSKKAAIANEKVAELAKEEAEGLQKDLENLIEKNNELELAKLNSENQDDLWNYTKQENTLEAYTNYINVKGDTSVQLDSVSIMINNILSKSGYVQFLDSDGKKEYFTNFDKIPGIKDLFQAKSARSVRNGVIGASKTEYPKASKNTSRTGDVILNGQLVKKIREVESGNSIWFEIEYSN